MSAIAHWIEQQGISTVVIGLVRLHLEKIKPPRALWVPFELGRPLGAPNHKDFQIDVLSTALGLVESLSEPAIEDFALDDPTAKIDASWEAPDTSSATTITEEITLLKPLYQKQCVNISRTSVGVAKIPITEAAALLDKIIDGAEISSSRDDISPNLMMRLAIDDLKAYYIEAAIANNQPSSQQVYNWLWQDTALGRNIRRLRQQFIESKDAKLKAMGEKFFVPHQWRDSSCGD